MQRSFLSSLRLALIVLIAFIGMAGAIHSIESPYQLASILALMTLGVAGMGLDEWRSGGREPQGLKTLSQGLEARELALDGELTKIAGLIRAHLDANGRYSDSLTQADRNLPFLTHPEKVRAIVGLLIEANEKMRRETNDLSNSLEKSRGQVASLRSKLAEAQAIGMRDALTSLGNRRSFDSQLAKKIAEAQAADAHLCLALGDLDHFKKINDSFGHPFGDHVLKRFAELLTKHVKDGVAARLGGEEFALILPRTAIETAEGLVDQVRTQLEAQQWTNAENGASFGNITASFGVVRLGKFDDAESLVKRADAMLYEAKRSGRNCIVSERETA
jgi:diguanylate cyclase